MKIFKHTLIISVMLIISLVIPPGIYAQEIKGGFKPFSREFIEWQNKHQEDNETLTRSLPDSVNYSGYIPIPVDLSHLAENPPNENLDSDGEKLMRSDTIPSTYDLRNVNGTSYVTSVKAQQPYGTCWAFASIGAMESNMLKQGYSAMDLSEMHLAYFAMSNSDKSKAFYNLSGFTTIMNHGGNTFMPTALYARLSGPVNESELPYGTTQPSASTPESYTRVLRLKEVYYISRVGSDFGINANETSRNIIKQRIMETGAVVATYYNNNSAYNKTASNGTAYYSNGTTDEGHAVQIIGWDDNYAISNFGSTKPSTKGAWLIKNSWGNTWNSGVGDNGCFWMSYAQDLSEGSAFIVEEADSDMKVYDYDSLGWYSVWGYTSTNKIYFGNIFQSERSEKLTEVGFYTPDNNINYQVNVYKGMSGISASSPIYGSSLASASGTIPYAGYHTVNLGNEVSLSSGEYFSVVVTFTNHGFAPVEMKSGGNGFTANAVIEEGSFVSYNGTNWTKGTNESLNVCVKAFTLSENSETAPAITTNYPPDAYLNTEYSATLTASGTKPITWSVTGNFPDGLTLDSSTGTISGTPTTLGSYTFNITAANDYGSDSKNFTMNVKEPATITTTSFTGYVGYTFSEKLSLANNASAKWTTSDKLPGGLKLNASTGAITGKPTKSGTYSVTFKAVTSTETTTGTVTFTINAKPTAAKISTSSLTAGMIGESYSGTIKFSGTDPVTLTVSGLPGGLSMNTSTGTISGTPTEAGTFTVTVTASNIVNTLTGNSPATKNIKLVIKAKAPVIAALPTLADGIAGEKYNDVTFTTTAGTEPITWSASGLPKGLSLSSSGILSGTPTKAGNFNITLKASNAGGKASLRVAMKVLQKPEITTTKLSDATDGKKFTGKLSAKGTTPISWNITGLPDGLTFTQNSTGSTATITGTPTTSGNYTITAKAENGASSVTRDYTLNVKAVAPKLKVSLAKGKAGTSYTGSTISATGTLPITIAYSISDSDKAKFKINSLEDAGLTFTANPETGTAAITGTPDIALKSLPITFTASNTASTVNKKTSLTVTGDKAAFTSLNKAANLVYDVGESVNLDFEVTGTKFITFSMNNISGFTLTQTGDYTAHLSGKAPAKPKRTTINIYASNSAGKTTNKIIIQTQAKSEAKTQAKPVSESQMTLTAPQAESIALGGTNTTLNLDDYEIIAKLPAISVDESGMHDFTNIELDESADIGAELIWLANSNRPSSDDEIAEFYDTDGTEITSVTDSHTINISAWLNPDVTYEPRIAVKRKK